MNDEDHQLILYGSQLRRIQRYATHLKTDHLVNN